MFLHHTVTVDSNFVDTKQMQKYVTTSLFAFQFRYIEKLTYTRDLASDPSAPFFFLTDASHLRRAEKQPFWTISHHFGCTLHNFGRAPLFKKMDDFEILDKSLLEPM